MNAGAVDDDEEYRDTPAIVSAGGSTVDALNEALTARGLVAYTTRHHRHSTDPSCAESVWPPAFSRQGTFHLREHLED